ncbi:MAG: hypothetical protein AAF611_06635 [Bacteroidota bacterium]
MQKPFTQNDRKKIQQKIGFTVGIMLFAIAMFTAIYLFVLRDFMQKPDTFTNIPAIMFGIFGVFFVGVIVYMLSIFTKDLKSGVKNCIEGVVEDKRLNIKKSTSRRTGTGTRSGRSSSSSTQRYYYITMNGEAHKIEYKMYVDIKVGNTIYFEVAPNSKTVLSYKILESQAAKTLQTVPKLDKRTYPSYKTKQAPLTRRDEDSIRAFYDKKLRKHLTYIAIVGLPIFGLIYNDLMVFVLFLFPLPIILVYQLYKAIALYFNFKRSLDNRKKNLTTTQIIDKVFTTITRNGSKSSHHSLKTTYKTIKVPEDIYGKVTTGNEIIVHEATHLATAIGLTLDDQYYPF